MAKLKTILCLLLVGVMGFSVAACDTGSSAADQGSSSSSSQPSLEYGTEEQEGSNELKLFQSDFEFTPEERMSRIKAEYLIENKGYSENDEVVAILSLNGDALIDTYLADEELSEKMSVGEFAKTPMGIQKKNSIAFNQTDFLRRLTSQGLITSVNYTYTTIANAVAVTTTYGNFLKIEQLSGVKSASLAETYSRPQESDVTDASAIENAVDVYETGIFNSGSAKDPDGQPYTGKGTSVAVLDSGFALSHPAYNSHEPQGELMFKYNDIKNMIADGAEGEKLNAVETTPSLSVSDVYYSSKIPFHYDYADKDPDVSPYDSEHGTHVAGIIGGYADSYTDKDGNPVKDEEGNDIPFRGIAIDTQLVLMKVFPDLSEGAETDDILAALEDAVLLGVDAINMSLGAACGFVREKDGDPVNDVYDKINASGVSLVTAASNHYSSAFGGAQGNTSFVTNPDNGTIGSPSTYPAALSVASIDGIKSKYIVGNGSKVFFFNESNSISGEENNFFDELFSDVKSKGERYNFTESQHPNRYNNVSVGADGTLTVKYVTVPGYGYRVNYSTVDVEGKIALVSRGDSTFEDKALQAKNAGAIGCIIYNNIEGDILMSMGKTDHIPTISISKEDGTELAKVKEGTLTLSYEQEAGPFMSDFSSWGPLPDLTLKPDITAHGGNITSSVPGDKYDQISGTSMACPNMCGLVVLIRQFIKDQSRYNDMTWKQISVLTNQMLMSTATIILNQQGNPYSPRKQGAGLASLNNVVNTKAYLTVDGKDRTKLELMDDPQRKGVYVMEFNIVNVSDVQMQYDLGLIGMTESVSTADEKHIAERDQLLSNNFTAEVVSGQGSISGKRVSVGAGQTAKIKLTYTLSQEDKNTIESLFPYGMYVEGFVTLDAVGEKEIDLNIPFLAFYGDWTQAPIFDKTYFEVESEAHNAGIDEEDKLKADYYATTPYGSYYYNYLIPLGTYLYDIDESTYDPIPASEDRIAISNELNKIDGISSVYAGLLRGCKTMTYTITDKETGEVVYEYVLTNARKAFSQGGSPIPNYEFLRINSAQLGLMSNRRYEFKMVGQLDYERDGLTTNARNTFSFDFTLDTEAPIIKSATYEKVYDKNLKKDRYYVYLTIYDNQYAMALTPLVFSVNPEYDGTQNSSQYSPSYLLKNPIPLYGDKGEDYRVRVEITDILENLEYDELIPSALGFTVEDYALNQNLYVCQLPGTNPGERGKFSFTNDGTTSSGRKSLVTLEVGEVVDLTQYLATTDPSVDENKDYLRYLIWESNNDNIASVKEGQVLGKSTGRTIITVRENFYGDSATITVNVRARQSESATSAVNTVVPLSANDIEDVTKENIKSIRFSYFDTLFAHARAGQTSDIGSTGDRIFLTAVNGAISVYPGEQIQLHYDLDPWYVADKYDLTYASSRSDIVSVTEDGVVAALKKGSATITLSVGGSNLIASIRITVNSEFVIDEARTLVAYKGVGGNVVIPDDEGILYIGPNAFSLYETNYQYAQELPDDDVYANRIPGINDTIRSVVVPDGVMEIQQYAFYNCTALETVELPDTVKFLRRYAFYNDVSLKTINLEDVEVIGDYVFTNCETLDNINMPSMYTVGKDGFRNCTGLTSVDLTTLRNAGENAFAGCTKLKNVTLGELTKLSVGIFRDCGLESVEIFEKKFIPANAFSGNESLTSVTFKNGLEAIHDSAFSGDKSLQKVVLPNSAFTLGANVFQDCAALATIEFQANTQIDVTAGNLFRGTALATITVPENSGFYSMSEDGHQLLNKAEDTIILAAINAYQNSPALTIPATVTHIGNSAFSGAPITSVTFEGAVEIGSYAFASCESLASVTFAAAGETTVGLRAFNNCQVLATLNNLGSVKTIGDYAFTQAAALTTAEIGANAEVGEGAFLNSGLTSVKVGANAKLGLGVFQRCTSLQTVTMPEEGGVEIGALCFSNNTKLSEIDLSKATGALGNEAFFGCTALGKAELTHITSIGDFAFANCGELADLTFGDGLTWIGYGAFMDYSVIDGRAGNAPKITVLEFPASLVEMDTDAFYGCDCLYSVTFHGDITVIPTETFAECVALATVTLPETCKEIGDYAFVGCSALSEINLGNVEKIGRYAFTSAGHYDDGSATGGYHFSDAEIDLSAVEEIADAAFADTAIGGTIEAPKLTTVGAYAFQSSAFTSFNAPHLARIGDAAFQGNLNLTGFNFSTELEEIGSYVFLNCDGIQKYTFGTEKKSDGAINGYAKLVGGVLYTNMANGKQLLSSVPAGMNVQKLEVEEGTYRIGNYAGSANTHIASLVLPDSLVSIGDHAFYGYTALKSVEFRSATAPTLESSYDPSGSELLESTDPGYAILHNQQSMYGWLELTYYNFIDLVGRNNPIEMILPANEVSGYDNVIYLVYFGSVANAQRSNYVAMEQAMKNFLEYAAEIEKIDTITMAHEKLISDAVAALNAVKQDPADHGIEAAEWERLRTLVTNARSTIVRLKIANSTKEVRDIQALIDALPDTYVQSQELDSRIVALRDAISRLDVDERGLLVQDKYNNLLSGYEAAHPGTDPNTPDTPSDPGGAQGGESEEDGCGSVIGVGGAILAGIVLLSAACVVLVKKKENK